MLYKFQRIKTILLLFILLFTCCFIFHTPSYAAEFITHYDVHYYPTLQKQDLTTRVTFKIKIVNLKPDTYIKTFSLLFPKTFQIGNIKVSDDKGVVNTAVSQSESSQIIKMDFSDPTVGLNTENTLYLEFLQTDLFKINGNTWEVIIPTIENRENGEYIVTVHMPLSQSKKISISKPKPDLISGDQIIWNNPKNKTIYAVFGQYQIYSTKLRYHLSNPNFSKVFTDIVFPPDTLYQTLYINSILPKPDNVYRDDDGNYIGRYFLNPKESKDIIFDAYIQVNAQPRDDIKGEISQSFLAQKKYLLSVDKNWTVADFSLYKKYDSIESIYSFVISKLRYNYGRLTSKISRLGAEEALKYPDQAVCTEFSDVFIALAKENGFYAREIQGFGFSNNEKLRPLSIKSDVLHSWSEYFDEKKQIWVPIDPTWENTSGIDYFSSFDLNHIVFAIHGKKSDYPYPAGSYKLDDASKDIQIIPTDTNLKKNISLTITRLQQPIILNTTKTFQSKIRIENTGNSYIWNYPITLFSEGVRLKTNTFVIQTLAPYEKKEINIEYELKDKWKPVDTEILFYFNSNKITSVPIHINPIQFLLMRNILIIVGFILIVFFIIKLIFHK